MALLFTSLPSLFTWRVSMSTYLSSASTSPVLIPVPARRSRTTAWFRAPPSLASVIKSPDGCDSYTAVSSLPGAVSIHRKPSMALLRTLSTSAARSSGLAGACTSTLDLASLCPIRWLRISLASTASFDAMTMCLTPVALRPARYMMPMMTANNAGTRMVVNRKARPRICSRYSRLAIRVMLRIGLASHGLNEDLFERRLDQFEAVDGGHGSGLVQQPLRIAVGMKSYLGVA